MLVTLHVTGLKLLTSAEWRSRQVIETNLIVSSYKSINQSSLGNSLCIGLSVWTFYTVKFLNTLLFRNHTFA